MTNKEFSDEFDILLNSFSFRSEFGIPDAPQDINLDEYEKSCFLTEAQEDIVKDLYKGNYSNTAFEGSEELRRYLSTLIKTVYAEESTEDNMGLSSTSKFFLLPEDLLYITYEAVVLGGKDACIKGKELPVLPTTQDEYAKIKNNPFRGANNRRALRLDFNNKEVEIISEYPITKYLIRYLAKPTPIILLNLPNDLSINGYNEEMECTLNSILHRDILRKAAQLALTSKSINKSNRLSN